MQRSSATRRLWLSAVLMLVFGALVVPATPAAADANDYWTLTSGPATVRRDGVDYKMSIMVSEFGNEGETVSITLAKTRNPDGPAIATQSHSFSFPMQAGNNRFTHPELNLSRAAVDTAGEMGTYGRLDLNFAQDRDLQTSCNGHNRTRAGTLSGSVNFKTHTARFGLITNRPARATLSFFDGECPGGPGPGGTPCPSRTRSISGSRYSQAPMYLSAGQTDGASTASLFWSTSEALDNAEGNLSHFVSATLPESKFALNDATTAGTVSGAPGTWVSGTATYAAESSTSGSPANCGTDKEWLYKSSVGSLTGNLAVDFFIGADRSVGQAPIDSASAYRTIVRPR